MRLLKLTVCSRLIHAQRRTEYILMPFKGCNVSVNFFHKGPFQSPDSYALQD